MRRRLAALIVGALLVTGACSDDDEGGFSFGGGEGTEGSVPGQSGDGGGLGDGEEETGGLGDGGSGGEAFGEQSMSTFVANCANFPGASESLCECAWDEISGRVSASEYAAFEEEFLGNPDTPLPGWLTDAVAGCS